MRQPTPPPFLSRRGTWCKTWDSGVKALIKAESSSYSQVSDIQKISIELSLTKSLRWQHLFLTEWTLRRLRLREFFLAKSVSRFFFATEVSFPNNKSPSLYHSGAFTWKGIMLEVSLTILYAIHTLLHRVTVTIFRFVPSGTIAAGSWLILIWAIISEMVELVAMIALWYKEVIKTFTSW